MVQNQNARGTRGKSLRGFASMDPEQQRAIASAGGRAAHAQGTAHEFTPEEAREAGRKGGQVVSKNSQHMAAIGRKGGEASGGGRARLRHMSRLQANDSADTAGNGENITSGDRRDMSAQVSTTENR
jgi:general stress protein YciG